MSNRLKIALVLLTGAVANCSDPPLKEKGVQPPSPARYEVKEDSATYIYEGKNFHIVHVGSNDPRLKKARDAEMQRRGVGYTNMAAALSGILKISNECLVVGLANSGIDNMIAFRGGEYSWDNRTSTFTYLGKSYKIGDEVNFAGGDFDTGDPRADEAARAALFAYGCDVSKSVFFVN